MRVPACPRLLAAAVAVAAALAAGAAAARPFSGVHNDRRLVPKRCATCHRGHGVRRTPMLSATSDRLCFGCHGGRAGRDEKVKAAVLSSTAQPANIEAEFRKPYRHPIERANFHRARETLPERDGTAPRHVACADCHDVHRSPTKEPRTLLGLRPRRSSLGNPDLEAAMCFRCHGASANRPGRSPDVARQFTITNASSHTVFAPGRPGPLPSLLAPWTPSSVLSCSDCHGNDERDGPAGPHGSRYQYLLRDRYTTLSGAPESASAYALCYRCHSRRSVLGNVSFAYHRQHVVGLGGRARRPASCRACHSAHGSERRARLIDFDRTIVLPDQRGRISYQPGVSRGGGCRLTCHGVEHPIGGLGDTPAPLPDSPRLPPAPGIPRPEDIVRDGKPRILTQPAPRPGNVR